MHITDHLKQGNGKTLFSIELIPPTKGKAGEMFTTVEALLAHSPTFVSVTAHPNEVRLEKKNGDYRVHITRRGLNTNMFCVLLKERYNIEAVPHIIALGFNKAETEEALFDLNYFGIDNVLALRGDTHSREHLNYVEDGYQYASELVTQISAMNDGRFLDTETKASPSNFCIGVAGYPEGHERANVKESVHYLKRKVDSGASFVVTNMFFDNDHYYRFIDEAQKAGIDVPIIPGLKPVYTHKHLDMIPNRFHVSIPQHLREKIGKYDRLHDRKAVGVEHIVRQSEDLIQQGVPCLHFYTISKAPIDDVLAILRGEESKRTYGL